MEPIDVYADGFEAMNTPYDMVINFNVSIPRSGGISSAPNHVATLRLSHEMTKVMVYILMRLIKRNESDSGITYPVPAEVLNGMKIAKEDWDALWQKSKFEGDMR